MLDLEANGEPDVVLGLYTGCAHCCYVDQVYRPDPGTLTYVKTEHYFGNAGATIKDLHHDGHLEFVSTNDAFYYRFGSFADSGAPVQIWSFRAGRFTDITRHFPGLIRRDAALWWKLFTHHYDAGQSLIAPWAADQDLLGHRSLVKRTLARQLALGHLRGGEFQRPPVRHRASEVPAQPGLRLALARLQRLVQRLAGEPGGAAAVEQLDLRAHEPGHVALDVKAGRVCT